MFKTFRFIKEYESDTFSAEESDLTDKEAEDMAGKLLDILLDRVDGVLLSGILAEIREDKAV